MSLITEKMYRLKCDRCGKKTGESQEICAWDIPDGAYTDADSEGWLTDYEGKDYCEECSQWNQDETELIPKE